MDGFQPVASGQGVSFRGRDFEHATAHRHRTVPQQERHQRAELQEARDPGHGALALARIEMHPHRRQHDEIEALAPCVHLVEVGQGVVDPGDRCVAVQALAARAQFRRRLDGHDGVAESGQGSGVAPGAGADIEDAARRRGDEMQVSR
jgi:hypothetical protein